MTNRQTEITGDLAPPKPRFTGGAAGHVVANHPKVSVSWPLELFNAINRLAEKNKTSFGQEARRLCALGLKLNRGHGETTTRTK